MTYRAPQDDQLPDQRSDGDAVGVYDRPERAQSRSSMTPWLGIVALLIVLGILALLFLL